jgi:DNA-binding response OmpR family regulator
VFSVPLTILVVESDATVVESLHEEGNVVVAADTPNLALELAMRCRPDVVLLDLRRSRVNGHVLAKELRSGLPWTTPIMMIHREDDHTDPHETSADFILRGSFELERLCDLMRFLHGQRRAGR